MSKVKCFTYHKLGHFTSHCHYKKKGKGKQQVATFVKVDEFFDRFEKEFSFFSCLSSSMSSGSWYIDKGASCHMTGVREIFTSLVERDMDLDIDLGDNAKYSEVGLGTIAFWIGSNDLLEAKDVLYVLALMKNLLPVSQMEDKGLTVTFDSGRVLIYLIGSSFY